MANVKAEVKLETTVQGKTVYGTPTGIKFGSKGKVQNPSLALAPLTKADRRRIRKALDKAGRRDLSIQSLKAHEFAQAA